MTSFTLQSGIAGEYVFIDELVIWVGDVYFGIDGTPTERNVLVSEIRILLRNLERQQQYQEFLQFLSAKSGEELYSILSDACWGSGEWKFETLKVLVPSDPHMFVALPAATELFDGERAFLIESTTERSRIVYRKVGTNEIAEVEVQLCEYSNMWREVMSRISGID